MTAHNYEDMLQASGSTVSLTLILTNTTLVRDTRFWRSSAWTPQYTYSQGFVWSSPLAWSRQAPDAYGLYFSPSLASHHDTWQHTPHLPRTNMCSISNTGATTRADCKVKTSGEKCSHSGTRVLQAKSSKTGQQCATTKAAEPENLQVPFAWWLPPHDSTIWYNRLILYSAGEFFLASGQMRCLISIIYQSEREHRTSKGRHVRTNGRSIPQQLSKIEQRQRHIRMIRENLNGSHLQRDPERITVDPNTRYNMGTSQNFPVHIPTFLQRNEGDPAIKVRVLISSKSS